MPEAQLLVLEHGVPSLAWIPGAQALLILGGSTLIRTPEFCREGSIGKRGNLGCNDLLPVEGIQQLHPKFARLAFLPLTSTQSN